MRAFIQCHAQVNARMCVCVHAYTCTVVRARMYACVCVYMQACCGMYAKHAHIRIHISSHTCLTSCIHYISGYRYSHSCIDFRWWCISASVIAAILFVFRRRDHTLFNDNVHQMYCIALPVAVETLSGSRLFLSDIACLIVPCYHFSCLGTKVYDITATVPK